MADTPEKSGSPKRRQHAFQAPKGTRDFYPDDLLKRRWIEETWRQVALRHGFDEIDGPRFEHTDLYTVKSGDGILSELFSFTRAGGKTAFALRPEFTPTLARMVAARANSLPKPIKWFSVGPYFRAERPQRGRLREFLQWNVDIVGDDSAAADADLIACCVEMLRSVGLTQNDVRIRVSNRKAISLMLLNVAEVPSDKMDVAFALLDQLDKLTTDDFDVAAAKEGLSGEKLRTTVQGDDFAVAIGGGLSGSGFNEAIDAVGCAQWCEIDASIVRGLAYYTGMVFEVHEVGGKERAIAGGGRYDKLVELFGGPPTPACGFAMGDVVLSLVLQDKGLMPSGVELAQTLGARPDVFVISTGSEESETALLPLVAQLRRSGLHARHTSRTTRNVGKLLKEAAACHARFAVILDDNAQSATLKNLDSQEQQENVALDKLAAIIKPTEQ